MSDEVKDLLGKLGKGVKFVKVKTKGIADSIKLKSEIKETEEEIRKKLQRIGEIVFNLTAKEQIKIEEIDRIILEIEGCYKKIRSIEKELEEIELATVREAKGPDAILCPTCKAINKIGDNFCISCGKSFKSDEDVKVCFTCEFRNPQTANYCKRCGRPLN